MLPLFKYKLLSCLFFFYSPFSSLLSLILIYRVKRFRRLLLFLSLKLRFSFSRVLIFIVIVLRSRSFLLTISFIIRVLDQVDFESCFLIIVEHFARMLQTVDLYRFFLFVIDFFRHFLNVCDQLLSNSTCHMKRLFALSVVTNQY